MWNYTGIFPVYLGMDLIFTDFPTRIDVNHSPRKSDFFNVPLECESKVKL